MSGWLAGKRVQVEGNSPAIAKALADFIEEQGYAVQCIHRDIQK